MTINQQRKPPAKRASNRMAGSFMDRPIPPDPDQEFEVWFEDGNGNRIEVSDLPAHGIILTLKRGRPRSVQPLSAKQRKQNQRAREAAANTQEARRKLIDRILTVSETHGRHRSEITIANAENLQNKLAKSAVLQPPTLPEDGIPIETIGDRRRGPGMTAEQMEGREQESVGRSVDEEMERAVEKQRFTLNWGLSGKDTEGYVVEFAVEEAITGYQECVWMEHDPQDPNADANGYVAHREPSTLECKLCGVPLPDWNESKPAVPVGKDGKNLIYLGGACAHVWLNHHKEVRKYIRSLTPKRVVVPKCSQEDHDRKRNECIQDGATGRFRCGVCHRMVQI